MTITKSGELASFYTVNKAPIKHLKVYFSPKQAGSGDPSSENIRSIEGWNAIQLAHSGKNLFPFKLNSYGPVGQWVNGTGMWWNKTELVDIFLKNKTITFSADFDMTNVDENNITKCAVKLWSKNQNGTWGILGREGSYIANGNAGRSKITYTYDNYKENEFGVTLPIGAVVSNPMVELSSTMTEYEPYKGTIQTIEFSSQSKNLFNPQCDMLNYASTYTIGSDGSITQKQSDGRGWTDNINFKPIHLTTGTYTITCSDGNALNISTSLNNYATQTRLSNGSGTFTLEQDCDVKIKHSASSYPTTYTLQLEQGSTATTYEPFYNTIYGGYVDLITGELVQTHANQTYDGSSDELWTLSGTDTYVLKQSDVKNDERNIRPLCDKFLMEQTYAATYTVRPINNNLYANSVSEWRTWLSENPIQVVYQLTTPITHQLTPTQLQTFIGQNNIWSNADRVEVEYDLAESNDELYRRRNIILRGYPHIKTTSGNIASFQTDMIAPIKSAKVYFEPMQEGSGDPSPENIRSISGWTESTTSLTGTNIWDEQVELGSLSTITGEELSSTSQIRTKNYIPVKSGAEYCIVLGSTTGIWTLFYDKNKQLITDDLPNGKEASRNARRLNNGYKLIIPDGCAYIRWYFQISYGTEYNNDTSINYPSTYTSYHQYNGTTIPITFPATTNLFNEQWELGNIEVGNNAGSSTCMRTDFINVNPSTSYYLYTSRENNVFVFEYLEDGTYANKVNGVHTSHIFTTGSTTKKIRIVDRNSGTETVNTGINYPATITYYEPYGTIYGGYVDLVNGEIVQKWYKQKITAYIWNKWGSAGLMYVNHTDIPRKAGTIVYCNNAVIEGNGDPQKKAQDIIGYYGTDVRYPSYFFIQTNIDTSSSATAARAYINETFADTYVVYQLENPIHHPLTPQILKTLKGTNNIWSNANGNIEVKYWTH